MMAARSINWSTVMEDFYIRTLPAESVMVDEHGGAIWMTISIQRGRASTVLTKEQVKELIAALQQAVA
jgi:hypothetical protein